MKVLLGICGGIAAYKACDVVRRLIEAELEVAVVMTDAATRFVTPLTLQVLSGRPVATSLFEPEDPSIEHIRLARWPDAVLIAPATANVIGRIANGLADDLLTTVLLATRSDVPVVLGPAMNTAMWDNPLVQRNLATLLDVDGGARYRVVEPVCKTLACGEEGVGALAEVEDLTAAVMAALAR